MRRVRVLWLLGFFASLSSILGNAGRTWLATALPRWLNQFNQITSRPELAESVVEEWIGRLGPWVAWGPLAFLASLLILWLVMTVAEGGLIIAVLRQRSGEGIRIRQTIRQSWGFLARFIGIDTLAYFPLFILLLAVMVVMIATLGGIAALAQTQASLESALAVVGLGALCAITAFCLMIPFGFAATLFRTLAFRELVLNGMGARHALRSTWQVIRRETGSVLILAALIWGVRYLLNLVIGLVTLPAMGAAVLPVLLGQNETSGPFHWLVAGVLLLLAVVVYSFLNAFSSTIWTLGYAQLAERNDESAAEAA